MANKEGVVRNVEHNGVLYRFLLKPIGILNRISRTGSDLKLEDEKGWEGAEAELIRLGYRGNY